MVYIPFEKDRPIITDTGAQVVDDTRFNHMALRDAVVAGALVGWNMATTGPADEPTQILYSDNATTEAVKLTVTWGTTGGEDGNQKTVVYRYSSDEFGDNDELIGTWTGTYDAGGSLTVETWS